KQFNVDVVFAGHEHHYERSYNDEITHIVTGGAGAPLRWPWWRGSNPSSIIRDAVYHTCFIEANRSSFQFTAYDKDRSIIDAFSLEKKENELAVQNIEVTEYPSSTNSSFGIIARVMNNGKTRVEDVPVLFELDDWSWDTAVSLDPGEAIKVYTSVTLSVNTTNSMVKVIIDPSNEWVENRELNNHRSLNLVLPSSLTDLQIGRLIPLETWNSETISISYGVEIQNKGISPVVSTTLRYITDSDFQYQTKSIGSIDGLETVIVELGTVVPANGILLEASIDPLNEITESNEGNNEITYGWNGVSNKTVDGATFPEYLRPRTPFKVSYSADGALSDQQNVELIYSADGWTTFNTVPLNKTISGNCEGIIIFDSSEDLLAFNFGFTSKSLTDFAGQRKWTVLNHIGLKAVLDYPRILTITSNEKLVVNFLDTRTYVTVSSAVKGWMTLNDVVYAPVFNGNGVMEFDVSSSNLSTDVYDMTVYAWTWDFQAIKISKEIGLIFSISDSTTTLKKTTFLEFYIIFTGFFSLTLFTRISKYRKKK
ncbi:MAG: CARDB domain-containing protein, partial [Candidatus Hodarchaeales archaeon]